MSVEEVHVVAAVRTVISGFGGGHGIAAIFEAAR
jgi:hypothetical protein